MTKTNKPFADADKLRRCANQQLAQQQPSVSGIEMDAKKLLHEIQVHQIELEMQKEELLIAQTEVETSLERYTELCDMAPVGYLTLGLLRRYPADQSQGRQAVGNIPFTAETATLFQALSALIPCPFLTISWPAYLSIKRLKAMN